MPVYILGTEEVRTPIRVSNKGRETNTIKKENIIKDYTEGLKDLKVIAKGSESPHSTHQGDGLYTMQLANIREYIDNFSDALSEVANIAAEFVRTGIGYLISHRAFLNVV